MGDHLGSTHFVFFSGRNITQIRQICQILRISLNYEKNSNIKLDWAWEFTNLVPVIKLQRKLFNFTETSSSKQNFVIHIPPISCCVFPVSRLVNKAKMCGTASEETDARTWARWERNRLKTSKFSAELSARTFLFVIRDNTCNCSPQ